MQQQTKSSIRKKKLHELKQKKIVNKKARELKLQKKILSSPLFQNAKTVAIYSAIQHEINLNFMFDFLGKKKIYLPIFKDKNYHWQEIKNGNHLIKGKYDILEPIIEKNQQETIKKLNDTIELFFIPAIAFHIKNNWRIGRGKGYYDKLLQNAEGIKIGLGFTEQGYNENHSIDKWDICMNEIWLI